MKNKGIPKRGFRQRLDLAKYRLNLRAKLKNEPLEILIVTKEECIRELDLRNKQLNKESK